MVDEFKQSVWDRVNFGKAALFFILVLCWILIGFNSGFIQKIPITSCGDTVVNGVVQNSCKTEFTYSFDSLYTVALAGLAVVVYLSDRFFSKKVQLMDLLEWHEKSVPYLHLKYPGTFNPPNGFEAEFVTGDKFPVGILWIGVFNDQGILSKDLCCFGDIRKGTKNFILSRIDTPAHHMFLQNVKSIQDAARTYVGWRVPIQIEDSGFSLGGLGG